MDTYSERKPRRGGFTLVEILVVITIIGILAGLIIPAVVAARNSARRALIVTEIGQLDMALKEYKNQHGDYPPDFYGTNLPDGDPRIISVRTPARAAVLRHLRKRFPRLVIPSGTVDEQWALLADELLLYNIRIDMLTPGNALVFWLGGLPETGGGTKLVGFSANPRNPFDPGTDVDGDGIWERGPRVQPLYTFPEERIMGYNQDTGVWGPPPWFGPQGLEMAYVYFKARVDSTTGRPEYGYTIDNGNTFEPYRFPFTGFVGNVCRPYLDAVPVDNNGNPMPMDLENPALVRTWKEAKTFQIISAGLNDMFGCEDSACAQPGLPFRCTAKGEGFCGLGDEHDNITNFSQGKLEDKFQ